MGYSSHEIGVCKVPTWQSDHGATPIVHFWGNRSILDPVFRVPPEKHYFTGLGKTRKKGSKRGQKPGSRPLFYTKPALNHVNLPIIKGKGSDLACFGGVGRVPPGLTEKGRGIPS